MSRPLVSIVIPTYDRARYLPQAIDSVLGQDYEPLELVVLDDGSTDETPQLLADYAEREDPERFRWDRHPNMGQVRTVNRGLEMLRGDVFGFLSSDDFLYPHAIRRLVATLEADADAVAVHAHADIVDEQGRRVDVFEPPLHTLEHAVGTQDCAPGVGTLFRRSVYGALGGWNERYRTCPDFVYAIRAAALGPFVLLPEVVGAYRSHPGSITVGERGLGMARERLDLTDEVFSDPALAARLEPVREKAYRNTYFMAAVLAGGEVNAAGERFYVYDSLAPKQSQLARRAIESQTLNHRIALESAERQLAAQARLVDELTEAVRVYKDGRGHLEAAVAERDARIQRLQEEMRVPRSQAAPPTPRDGEPRPWWWRAGRRAVPPSMRPRLGAFVHRIMQGSRS